MKEASPHTGLPSSPLKGLVDSSIMVSIIESFKSLCWWFVGRRLMHVMMWVSRSKRVSKEIDNSNYFPHSMVKESPSPKRCFPTFIIFLSLTLVVVYFFEPWSFSTFPIPKSSKCSCPWIHRCIFHTCRDISLDLTFPIVGNINNINKTWLPLFLLTLEGP